MDDPRILFEDTHLVVIDKPAGLLSQGDISGDHNLVDWLRVYFGRNYVGLVHRLDRNTSGLMVVAKRSKSANRLTEALQKGELKRSYIAIVEGHTHDSKELKHFLLKNESTNETRVVKEGTKGAKEARLSYKCFCKTQFEGHAISALHIHLETGRGHQIRAQLSHESNPLLGDAKYKSNLSAPGRPALHSYNISFPHPMSQELLQFKEPLPKDLLRLLPKDIQWP
ncbi:MAG: RluA family pseudouridine synthase [Bdellovibrionota bacterium]